MKTHHVRNFKRLICMSALMAISCAASVGDVKADEVSRTTDSEPAMVTAKVSSATVQVAEPLTLELTVTASAGSKVDFPSVGKSLGNFELTDQIDRADVPAANDVNQRVWTRRLTLESIVTGDMEIPALEIVVHNNVGSQTLKSDAIPVRVISVLEDRADPTQFRDIQSVVDVTVPQRSSRTWLWWTLGGIGTFAATAMLFMAVAKRKTWMTPKAWAIRELDQLRNSDAMRSFDSEFVTANLTTILRDYLELQFDIATPVQTTNELLQVIETGRYMSPETTREVAKFFENSDLAQFAGLQLTQAELTKAIDDAQRLIEQVSSELQLATSATKSGEG